MRLLSLYVCIVVLTTACTITDEVAPKLDVTDPNVTITVNGLTAYSSLHSNWQAISCDDGSIPGFVPDGSGVQGVTVPLDEDLLTPVFPVEINVLAGDPGSGIRQIRVVVPPGPVSSSDAQTTSFQGYSQVLQIYTPPYASARAITYSYSRLNTNKIRHEFQLRDAANTWNEFRFQMDIAPESEVCS
jgi:hypothetical protein